MSETIREFLKYLGTRVKSQIEYLKRIKFTSDMSFKSYEIPEMTFREQMQDKINLSFLFDNNT